MMQTDKQVKYGFVILHYQAYKMTTECVSCLLERFSSQCIKIVIVDNASPNNSGKLLVDFYKNNDKVDVLLNPLNDGFARGNNFGYQHVMTQYQPDYVIVMNNDVLIKQDNFLNRIEENYKETHFAVLGPDIYASIAKKHQSPTHLLGFTKEEVNTIYYRIFQYVKHPFIYYYKKRISDFLIKIGCKKAPSISEPQWKDSAENVVLHGACYIFSPIYTSQRKNCFCPDTFLYFEEDILHFECVRDHLKIVYDPSLHVDHLEDVSTNYSFKSGYKKFVMKNHEMIKSIAIFLDIINTEKRLNQ